MLVRLFATCETPAEPMPFLAILPATQSPSRLCLQRGQPLPSASGLLVIMLLCSHLALAADAPAPGADADAESTPSKQDEAFVDRLEKASREPPRKRTEPAPAPRYVPLQFDGLGLPIPCTGEEDWLRLVSGEWLHGELYRMRRKSVEFKSDKLKMLDLKWKDVAELCVPMPTRFVVERRQVVFGPARLAGEEIAVQTHAGEVVIDRNRIVAILPGKPSEWNNYLFHGSIGLDARTGNTEQANLNASARLVREDRVSRAQIRWDTTFGTASGERNANRHRAEAKLDLFISRYIYANALDSVLTFDEFQNIDLRATPTSALGWHAIDRPAIEWDIEAGVGYQYTRYISVQEGLPRAEGDAVIRLGTRLSWDVTSDFDIQAEHDTVLVVTRFGQSNFHSRLVFSYDITDLLDIELSVIHDRTQDPVAREDDVQPERDDLQLIFSLAIELR